MSGLAAWLLAGSAGIILALGLIHLLYTFHGPKLDPRAPDLKARMSEVSPVISGETTMWRAWVGFNASHSLGAILFGLVYGTLALGHTAVLLASPVLLAAGLGMLAAYVALGRLYWFSVPYRAILAATVLYVGALVAAAL